MPRPTRAVRFVNVLGESDETPAAIPEGLSSKVENWYKFRSGLRRRNGYSSLADSLEASNLRLLQWCRVSDEEHLISVLNGDVIDWFADTPGDIAINGEDRLPASGDADCNSANVEDQLLIGNGTDENVRYKPGEGGSSDTAAQLDGVSQWYSHISSPAFETGNVDYTLGFWVYLDTIATPQVIVSKWSAVTGTMREYRIIYDNALAKFVMWVWDIGGGTGAEARADDGAPIAAGQWYYVVGWHDSVNNLIGCSVNDATPVTTAWTFGTPGVAVTFYVGRQEDIAAALAGRVMRGGYWKSAGGAGGVLSPALRTSLYNAGPGKSFASLTAGEQVALIAYWDFNNASGDDSSSALTTNDLTPVGTPTVALGVDTAIEVAQLMPAAPTTAPTVNLTVGSVHDSQTEQQGVDFVYRISFLSADGYASEPSPEGNDAAYTFGTNAHDATLTAIPICPAGQDCTGRRIYRRSGGSTVFRFVADILDNTTTTYNDAVLNDDLGEAMPSDADGVPTNKAMPPAKYWCEHNARALAAWNTTLEGGKRTLFISNKFEPWYCPELPDLEDVTQGTRAFLQGAGAGEITGVGSHGAYGVVFTSAAGFFLTGDSPDTFAVNKFANHGCVAHRTICSARDLLLWLGPEGVYAWQSGVTRLVSDDQRETIEAMTAAEMAGAHAFVWEDKYIVCFATRALHVDLEYNFPHQWGEHTGWQWRDSTVSEFSGTEKEKIYAALEGEAQVYQLETGSTDAGVVIPARWASKDTDCGMPAREKRAHYLELRFAKTTGTALVTLKTGSGKTIQTWAHNLASVDHADETVSRFFQSCSEYARSEFFRIDVIVSSSATEPPRLLAAGLHITVAS